MNPGARLLTRLLTLLVRAYQRLVSPLIPQRCRFYPSCSAYAVQALATHGAVKGTWLAGRRLLRCHPWNPGGIDHVPPADRFSWRYRPAAWDARAIRVPVHQDAHSTPHIVTTR